MINFLDSVYIHIYLYIIIIFIFIQNKRLFEIDRLGY